MLRGGSTRERGARCGEGKASTSIMDMEADGSKPESDSFWSGSESLVSGSDFAVKSMASCDTKRSESSESSESSDSLSASESSLDRKIGVFKVPKGLGISAGIVVLEEAAAVPY
jgi:hypothetical protein